MKKVFFVVLALFLISSLVYGINADKGFNWLLSKGSNGDYGGVVNSAMAGLALKSSGASLQAEAGLEFIKSQQDERGCFPKGNCKNKETAFALLLLNNFGESTVKGEEWLKKSQTGALTEGKWSMQIATQGSGVCKASYKKGNEIIDKDINVDKGKFSSCQGSTFFDLNSCLEPNLLKANPFLELDINCNELGPSTIISVIYNVGNSYYIIDEAATARSKIKVESGCFGVNEKGDCDKDTSLFVNWILHEIGSDFDIDPWAEANYDNNVLHNALLFLSTKDDLYADDLVKLQKSDGSFERNGLLTGISALALKSSSKPEENQKALDWLKDNQKEDGSWDEDVLGTAFVLHTGSSGGKVSLPSCTDGKRNGDEDGIDCGGSCPLKCEEGFCGDGICDFDESSVSCSEDCKEEEVCVVNGKCEVNYGETANNCNADCSCGDGICDDFEKSGGSCSQDCGETSICGNNVIEAGEECDGTELGNCSECNECGCAVEEGRGFSWWLFVLILVLLLFAIWIYLKYKDGGNKQAGGKKPGEGKLLEFFNKFRKKETKEEKSMYSPFTSRLQQQQQNTGRMQRVQYEPRKAEAKERKSKVDEELEASLKEARKLLGK